MADNNIADNNQNSTSMKSEEQTPQEFVLLSDDVKASMIRQEEINNSSHLSQKNNNPEKPEQSNESANVKSNDDNFKSFQSEPLKVNHALFFIGINSLTLNILSVSSFLTQTSAIVLIVLINLLTYLALYNRQQILTFLTKITKKTGEGFKKTLELVQKKKRQLFIIAGILTVAALVITFLHMSILITRLEQQTCQQSNILRNLQSELNELKVTQLTNQMLKNIQTMANTEESERLVNNLTEQEKQLESIVSNQQQQIQSNTIDKIDENNQFSQSQDKQTSQQSEVTEDKAGNINMAKTEKAPEQSTNQAQEEQKQQQKKEKSPELLFIEQRLGKNIRDADLLDMAGLLITTFFDMFL